MQASVTSDSTAHSSYHVSPAAASGRQQSLNALGVSTGAVSQQQTTLHHSPSAGALPKATTAVNSTVPAASALKESLESEITPSHADVSAGPGSRNATSSDIGRMSSQASSTGSLRAGSRRNSVPQFPMTSAKALLFQAAALTDYEQGEM